MDSTVDFGPSEIDDSPVVKIRDKKVVKIYLSKDELSTARSIMRTADRGKMTDLFLRLVRQEIQSRRCVICGEKLQRTHDCLKLRYGHLAHMACVSPDFLAGDDGTDGVPSPG